MNAELQRLDAAIAEKSHRLSILDEEALRIEAELATLRRKRFDLVRKEEQEK